MSAVQDIDDDVGRTLVRRFSDRLQNTEAGSSTLGQALIEKAEQENQSRDQRRRLFEDSEDEGRILNTLNLERDLLQKAWEDVSETFDSKSRSKIEKVDFGSFQDIERAVVDARETWQKKDRLAGGKAQKLFHKFSETIDAHKAIFEILPTEDKYAKVFCGSFRMLIEASVRHQKYIEELSRALDEISERMKLVIIMRGIMNTTFMRQRVVQLYAKVFQFLRTALNWYSSKSSKKIRFSLNASLYEELSIQVEDIRRDAENIFQLAVTAGLAEGREARLLGEETHEIARQTYSGMRNVTARLAEANLSQAEQIAELQRQLQAAREANQEVNDRGRRKQLGDQMAKMLEEMFHDKQVCMRNVQTEQEQKLVFEISSSVKRAVEDVSTEQDESENNQPSVSVEEVQLIIERINRYIIGEQLTEFEFPVEKQFTTEEISSFLRNWTSSSEDELLWLAALDALVTPSTLCNAASSVVNTAQKLHIPIISHACERVSGSETNLYREQNSLIGLVYSLIRQLIVWAPDGIWSPERLYQLDGTWATRNLALEVLEDLLSRAPSLLLCVIDGLNILDHRSTAEYLVEFLFTLWGPFGDSDKVFKILFTTSGLSSTMSRAIPATRVHIVESDRRIHGDIDFGGDTPLDLSVDFSLQE